MLCWFISKANGILTIFIDVNSKDDYQRGHVTAVAKKNGTDYLNNLAPVCGQCSKGT